MSELSEIDIGLNDLAFSDRVQQQQPNMPNRHGLYCEFYMNPVLDKALTATEGRNKYKEVPYIMIMVPGDKSSIIRRPIRTGQNPAHDNNKFHNEYVAFMQKKEAPTEGMPLSEWAMVTRSIVMELNHVGIKTVEHLASLSDTNVQKMMGLADLRSKAQTFLEAAESDAPFVKLHAEIDHRNEEISSLRATVEAMQTELAEIKGGKKKGK